MKRGLMLAVICLSVGAAPAEVPLGKFQTWASYKKTPLDFMSGGVKVHVEPLPCPARPVADNTCSSEGFNNQGRVTVRAAHTASLSTTTDPQSMYARIAVVRFGRNDPRVGVVIESQSGGSAGNLTAQVLVPDGDGRVVAVEGDNGGMLEGQLADFPKDVSGDGIVDLRFTDGAFDSVFGCNACTPRPPRLFAVKGGRVVDESRDPALRPVFAKDMARLAPMCVSNVAERNGACAAYVADAARAGRFRAAWATMLRHYNHDRIGWQSCRAPVAAQVNGRCPTKDLETFPDALRTFLVKTGYISAARSASVAAISDAGGHRST